MWITAAWHVAGLTTLAAAPDRWVGVGLALIANHAVLVGAGLSPRSHIVGPNIVRLPQAAAARGVVALTFDDGPDPDTTPRILDELQRNAARATFFCIGKRAERHGDLVRRMAAEGHQVENHSYNHPNTFFFYPSMRLYSEIEEAQAVLGELAGRAPELFRPPAGFRSPLLEPVLRSTGLRLASWTRRGFDTVCREPDVLFRRLTHHLAAGDILLLHDGHSSLAPDGRASVLTVLPRLLGEIQQRGLSAVPLGEALALAPAPDRP
jgi:peptidoglycan-N-acetylglucosamine deacetylase